MFVRFRVAESGGSRQRCGLVAPPLLPRPRAFPSIFWMSFAIFSSLRASTVSLIPFTGSMRALAASRDSAASARLHGGAMEPSGGTGRTGGGGALNLSAARAFICGGAKRRAA